MEAFNKLSTLSKIYKFKAIQPGRYDLVNIKKINTKFGETCVVTLTVNSKSVDVFLPKRYSKLTEKDIEQLNDGKYKIEYIGMVGKTPDLNIVSVLSF